MPHRHFARALALPAASLAALVASSAHGQFAIGDGTAIDANLRRGGDGRNRPRAIENFAVRNALVTGDVAGGREFRGSVGYTGARDFRGLTSTDSFHRFEASSAFSSPTAVLSGLSTDRYSLTGQLGPVEFTRNFTPPAPASTSLATGGQRSVEDLRLELDRANASGTARLLTRGSEGAMLGVRPDDQGRPFVRVFASPEGGVWSVNAEPNVLGAVELGVYDHRRLLQDYHAGQLGAIEPGMAFPTLGGEGLGEGVDAAPGAEPAEERPDGIDESVPGRIDAAVGQGRIDEARIATSPDRIPVSGDYEAIVARLLAQYGDRPDVVIAAPGPVRERLREELDRISRELGVPVPSLLGPADPDAPMAPEAPIIVPPETGLEPELEPGAAPGEEPAAGDRPSLDAVADTLRHGVVVGELSASTRSRLDELIRRGETRIAAGEYFDAERDFDRALKILRGHPLATAGLVHAQIGAGLYLSSALNLRRLFADAPEMIDTRYAPNLVPSAERLAAAEQAIRQLMLSAAVDRADYGLALAYVGRLQRNDAVTREGLDEVAGTPENDRLRLLLKRIWLDE